jgi:hypothetical protein
LNLKCLNAVSSIVSIGVGIHKLWEADSLRQFDIQKESLKWLAIAWALHEAMPGMVFAGCGSTCSVDPLQSSRTICCSVSFLKNEEREAFW